MENRTCRIDGNRIRNSYGHGDIAWRITPIEPKMVRIVQGACCSLCVRCPGVQVVGIAVAGLIRRILEAGGKRTSHGSEIRPVGRALAFVQAMVEPECDGMSAGAIDRNQEIPSRAPPPVWPPPPETSDASKTESGRLDTPGISVNRRGGKIRAGRGVKHLKESDLSIDVDGPPVQNRAGGGNWAFRKKNNQD